MRRHPKSVGTVWRLSDSSFRSDSSPSILHATDETNIRTLCGRDASDWSREEDYVPGEPPDCLICAKVWRRLMRPAV